MRLPTTGHQDCFREFCKGMEPALSHTPSVMSFQGNPRDIPSSEKSSSMSQPFYSHILPSINIHGRCSPLEVASCPAEARESGWHFAHPPCANRVALILGIGVHGVTHHVPLAESDNHTKRVLEKQSTAWSPQPRKYP